MIKQYADILDLSQIKDKRFIVIGDLHGCYNQLITLLEKCNYNKENDIIVCVGDLTDRGYNSDKVINFFLTGENIYSTEGNHDNKLKRHLRGNKVALSHGLKGTIEQIKDMDHGKILELFENFHSIIRLPDFNNKPFYITHAGFNGRYTPFEQTKETCLYIRGTDPKNYFDDSKEIWWDTIPNDYYIACGHIGSKVLHPQGKDNIFLLDGGCCFGLKLRAIIMENNKIEMIEVNGPKIDIDKLEKEYDKRNYLVEWGYVRCAKLDDIKIFTYTDKCVYEKFWTDTTINSRGHIFNQITDECVACAMPKFFNLNEREETKEENLPWHLPHKVYEKLDGWLGIHYRHNGKHAIATRGTFYSEVAQWATDFLNENYNLSELDNDITLIFEIICPATKIVVDYKGVEQLVLLTAYNRKTRQELDPDEVEQLGLKLGFHTPYRVSFESGKVSLNFCNRENNSRPGNELEGFVIRFSNGLRVKVKSEDYFLRSKIMKDLNPKFVWECMKFGEIDLSRFKDLDDESKNKARDLSVGFKNKYHEHKNNIETIFKSLDKKLERKQFVEELRKHPKEYFSAIMCLFDGKIDRLDYVVKQMIKP